MTTPETIAAAVTSRLVGPLDDEQADRLVAEHWAQHSEAAQKEGWDIFWATGSSYTDDQFQLQGCTEPFDDSHEAPFDGDDGAAWKHVWNMAATGSELHVAAKEFLRLWSHEEFKRLDDFVVRGIEPIYTER